MTKNLYEVLGVTQSASSDEIKKAYRTLSKEYHPDAGGDAERFNEINEAYTVLSDTNRRKRYDETGETNVVNNQERILEYMIRSIVEIITVTPMMSITQKNVIEDIIKAARSTQKEIARNQESLKKKIEKFEVFLKNFKVKDGKVNMIAPAIENLMKDCETQIRKLDEENEFFNELIKFASDYEYLTTMINRLNDGKRDFTDYFRGQFVDPPV